MGIFIIICIILIILGILFIDINAKCKIKNNIKDLANSTLELTPQEFFRLRNKTFDGKEKYALKFNFAGVYIIYNKTKNIYYVGQAKKILDRVNAHFTGHGNGDVYADFKYGDKFTIKMIGLKESGYKTLNELEKTFIEKYDSYKNGYNKTKGNK